MTTDVPPVENQPEPSNLLTAGIRKSRERHGDVLPAGFEVKWRQYGSGGRWRGTWPGGWTEGRDRESIENWLFLCALDVERS